MPVQDRAALRKNSPNSCATVTAETENLISFPPSLLTCHRVVLDASSTVATSSPGIRLCNQQVCAVALCGSFLPFAYSHGPTPPPPRFPLPPSSLDPPAYPFTHTYTHAHERDTPTYVYSFTDTDTPPARYPTHKQACAWTHARASIQLLLSRAPSLTFHAHTLRPPAASCTSGGSTRPSSSGRRKSTG